MESRIPNPTLVLILLWWDWFGCSSVFQRFNLYIHCSETECVGPRMSSNASTKIIALLWIWMSFDGCCLVSRWDKTGSHWYTLINNMFRTNSHVSLGFEHDWRSPKRLIKTKTGLGCFSAPACFFPAEKDGLPKSSNMFVMSRLGPQPIYTRMFAHAIRSQFSSCWFLLIQSNQKICRNPGTPEKMPSQKNKESLKLPICSWYFCQPTHFPPPVVMQMSRGYRSTLLRSMVSRPGALDFAKKILQESQFDTKGHKYKDALIDFNGWLYLIVFL